MSIEVRSELPFTDTTFSPKFSSFEISEPLEENVVIHHHFQSDLNTIEFDRSNNLYFRPPWAIYQEDERWIYQWIKARSPFENYYQTAVTNKDHSHFDIYNDEQMRKKFLRGDLNSLTMFPTDQILLGRLLSYRQGCIVHSLGIILNGKGYIFVGHSDAGKSTMALIMKKEALILCDDRNIIQKKNGTYRLSGTWSHGDVTDVSSQTAPLKGIFFLNQSEENQLTLLQDSTTIFQSLLACLIRPLETRDWWERSLDIITMISEEVPCWQLRFNKGGEIFNLIKNL